MHLKRNKVFLGLGSNLGDSAAQLNQALSCLDALPATRVLRSSRVFHSPAYSPGKVNTADPDFMNMVCLLETAYTPQLLLAQLLGIEKDMHRVRDKANKWGPRLIDIDILFFNNDCVDTPTLQIPHQDFEQRAFFVLPLYEIAPDFILPNGFPLADLVSKFPAFVLEK